MPDTATATFTIDELWLLQACVRHEVAQSQSWRWPPASLELNDAIADAILLCTEQDLNEAALLLTRGDCLAIDSCIPQEARGVDGQPLGRSVLLKSFRARRTIAGGDLPETVPNRSEEELNARIAEWKSHHPPA